MKTQKLLLLLQWLRPRVIQSMMWMKAQWLLLSTRRWQREIDRAQQSLDNRIQRLRKKAQKSSEQ